MRTESQHPDRPTAEKRDAGFFDAVHQMVTKEMAAQTQDRRGVDRQPYRCLQLIAPYRDGELPDQSQFIRVQCQDLSPGGFSYLSLEKPDYRQLIVALGAVPFTFLSAKVMHTRLAPQDFGQYLVGCQFIGRISG